MTTVDRDYWASVPAIDDAPDTGPDEGTARPVSRRMVPSRRTTLKAAGALGGALALNVLSWLPPARPKQARAAVGTEHSNCAAYDDRAGYNDNSKVCVGGEYSSGYCGSDGWFLNGSTSSAQYWPVVACGDIPYVLRNAWRWTHAGTRYRCADGNVWTPSGGTVFRICARANP